ncbi:MAG: chitobiase/beta-hexosaminidase C-terminal domain-containing protein, partial [Candidatus Paceibacterota bacterium]
AQFSNGTNLTSCTADTDYTLNANDYCNTNIGRPVEQRIVSSLQTNATVSLGHVGGSAWNNWVVSFRGAVTPVFSPIPGTYATTQNVSLTSTVSGATICYTTNGSDPTTDGAGTCSGGALPYSGAISVSSSKNIKAVATMSGMTDSVIINADYIIDSSAKVTFTTSGASFTPIITVNGHPNVHWEFGNGSTSDSLSPSVTFADASSRTNTLVVTPWSAIASINIGYNHNEEGTTTIPDLAQQNVTAVSGLSNAAPYLWAWVSWNNPLTALDFSNFTSLTTLDCSYCPSLDSIDFSNTPILSRLNIESSGLDTLDLSESPNIADFRGTANEYTSITWPTNGEPYLWHFCAHSMALTAPIADLSKFPSLEELWIRNDAQTGTLHPISTNIESVWAQTNQYSAANFSGNFPIAGTRGYIDIFDNVLTSLDISNNLGLEDVDAYNNRLTSLDVSSSIGLYHLDAHNNLFAEAAVDDILLDFDTQNTGGGYLDLTSNAPSSATGQSHAANLISRGWTVLTDGNTLTLGKAGNGGTGTVTIATVAPATTFNTCGTSCTGTEATLTAGTQVILTATPDTGSTFVGWSNGCSGTQSTCTVTLSADVTATATFTTEESGIHGPITQAVTPSHNAAATSLSAPTVTHTEGNLIAVHLAVHENLAAFGITDTQGNTYTSIGSSTLVGGDISGQWFYAFARATSLNTVTATFNGTFSTIRVLEYANIDTLSPVDVITSGAGATSPTFTTAIPNELILAAWHTGASGCTAGPGYTLLPNDYCGFSVARPAEERITSSVLTNTTASLVTTGGGVSGGWVVSFRAALKPPTFSLATGTFSSAQSVTLSTTDTGAAIHYTLDGSTPTITSTLYSSALSISSTTTVKTLATQTGFSNSAVASAAYTISYSSGGGGGSSSIITIPTIEKYEVTSIVDNLATLSFSVLNASQMSLSSTADFADTEWETYSASPTYIKADEQDKLYIKFKSSSGGISNIVELSLVSSDPVSSVPLFPNGTLIKTADSFKVYITLEYKKKWICTPEVFEQLGYKWTDIQELTRPQLESIPDYEDNLIRTIGDYKVYLVVNGVRRHIPNPEIFLDYGFKWDEVVDVTQETVNKYRQANLLKESRIDGIYYTENGIKKLIPTTEIFNSYGDKTEDVQIISKLEMQSYPTSHLIKTGYSPDIYLTEDNIKRRIPNPEVFIKYKLNWDYIIVVNDTEFSWYQSGEVLR